MKKIVYLIVAIILLCPITACSGKDKTENIDLSHFSCVFKQDLTVAYEYVIITSDIDIEDLVIECESYDKYGNILDTFTLNIGKVKQDRYYRSLLTGWSETHQWTFVAEMKISDAWGIIKK